ncbi:anti-sigma factor [Kocuria sp. M1R5S2]|uniref:anti-sigma factor n=1 Tax=Kocuria rhizosphaerae TaxID=3376285 RepID=UPI0037B047F4
MAHLSEETLTLLALGEGPDPRSRDHLESCPECAAELEQLRHVVRAGRASAPAPAAPGPGVWAAIHAELGLSDDVAHDPLDGARAVGAPAAPEDTAARDDTAVRGDTAVRHDTVPGDDPAAGGDAPVRGGGGADVVDLGSRRDRSRRGVPYPLAAAAVAAALFVGGAAVWGVQQLGLGPEPTLLARAELEPLAGYSARGSAEVDERPDGTRQLVVRTDPADVDGFKEVWLLAPDAQRMVSLGVMAGDEAVFVLPENLDVGEFPVVDVSDEPVDGDPTHSGDSIVRGVLET